MKTLKSISAVLIMLLSVFCVSCLPMEGDDYFGIDFSNNAESELYVVVRYSVYYESTGQYAREDELYKDSSLYHKVRLEANWDWSGLFDFEENPEKFLESTDTLTIFILDKEEYEGKTWSQIVDSAHFRQIYHLSGDDIRLLNAKVPYPPSEIMRNMDMVPSYEEGVR